MAGQPPVMPPTLSYRSKAKREQEEREERERQRREQERLGREQEERDRVDRELREQERRVRERAAREAAAWAGEAGPELPSAPPSTVAVPAPAVVPVPAGREAAPPAMAELTTFMDEERGLRRIDIGEAEGDGEEEGADDEEVKVAPEAPRTPPRPPKSHDMRPVYAGFVLVFTGLAEVLYGVWAMTNVPSVGEGAWSQLPKLGTFALGFSAVFLGVLAIRGGLWSFRKERFGVVKVGAIAATVCVWAMWIPWLFGLLALLIITRARDEYYPFYDPRWDAPSWVRPPPRPVEEEEGEEEETGVTEGTGWDEPAPGEGGDALST